KRRCARWEMSPALLAPEGTYALRPSIGTRSSADGSTASRHLAFTAAVAAPARSVPKANGAHPQVAQKRCERSIAAPPRLASHRHRSSKNDALYISIAL